MDRLETWNRWIGARRDLVFDLLRIYLGIGLFVKGLQFIADPEFLSTTLRESGAIQFKFDFIATFLAHYIPLAHIGGGLLLAAGLMTRVSTLFQLPILFGAVFFVHGHDGLFGHNQALQFTALVLFLLILILIQGPGRLSVDHHLKDARDR
jgi:uncharacterized membrane protein YphA (DoxX/SURF4 family)